MPLRESWRRIPYGLKAHKDLNHKKNEFVNSRLLGLGNTVDDSDDKKFWNSPK